MPTAWGEMTANGMLRLYARHAEKMREQFKPGDRLRIVVERDRNGHFNALYHVMVSLCVDAINSGPASTDIDSLKRWVKLQTGRYDVVRLPKPGPGGETVAIEYHSTSFASMGEDEFHRFAVDTCHLIRDRLAPWIEGSAEWPEIMELVNSIAREDAA